MTKILDPRGPTAPANGSVKTYLITFFNDEWETIDSAPEEQKNRRLSKRKRKSRHKPRYNLKKKR